MASLDRIRTHGFRRWYERQLIECHAWLVSWFLGFIVVVCGIELAGDGAASRLSGVLLVLGGLVVSLYSLKRYCLLLGIAERLGEQAVCPGCKAYGKFRVQCSSPDPLPDDGDPSLESNEGSVWLRARCRKCGDEWVLR